MNRVCLSFRKPSLQVEIYLVSFVDPELAGTHATHGSTSHLRVALLQIISRILQATYLDRDNFLDHLVKPLQLSFELMILFCEPGHGFLLLQTVKQQQPGEIQILVKFVQFG